MSQYRNGSFISAGAAVTLPLGFVPDKIQLYNYTVLAADSSTPAVGYSLWINNVVPSANALINTYTSGAPVTTLITSNGVTPVILGGDWQSTQYVITGITQANPGVVTVSSVSPTNTLTLVNGMTVTISSVVGMTQLNTKRYIIAGISGSTFQLYDTYGNPVNTSAFGAYVSGGIVNQISYPPTAPVLNATTGQVITPGQPAGNQYDIGYEGVILGTGVVGASTNLIWWEAFLNTPTGY
jgi:hypothetical protein